VVVAVPVVLAAGDAGLAAVALPVDEAEGPTRTVAVEAAVVAAPNTAGGLPCSGSRFSGIPVRVMVLLPCAVVEDQPVARQR
jgi:hypothetical protein